MTGEGGGGPAAAPLPRRRDRTAWRYVADRMATRVVTGGGVVIIGAILAILLVIALEVVPLFRPASAKALPGVPLPAGAVPLAVGVDEYREEAFVLTKGGGGISWLPLSGASAPAAEPLPERGSAEVVSAVTGPKGTEAAGLSDGRLLPLQVSFEVAYDGKRRTVTPSVKAGEPLLVDPSARPLRLFAWAATADGPVVAGVLGPREVSLLFVRETSSMLGGTKREEERVSLRLDLPGSITAVAVDGRGDDLFVGTDAGVVGRVDLREKASPRLDETIPVAAGSPAGPSGAPAAPTAPAAAVTLLGFLNGDRTLVVGDASGGVSSWQVLSPESGRRHVARIHAFQPHGAAVTAFSASRRDRGFVTGDASGMVHLNYGTTGKTLVETRVSDSAVAALAFAPKGDGFVAATAATAATAGGKLSHLALDNPHPEATLTSLFGKVWYEGYEKPEWVWQSTGGTDDFEPKLSLTPLVYGTLKGTAFALLFAVPMALLAALYTSQFMHPSLRSVVKPAIELMAGLPSVVLGFVAGLWLAPVLERVAPGLLAMPFVVALAVLASVAAWHGLPGTLRKRLPAGSEIWVLLVVVLVSGTVAVSLGGLVERVFLGGDYRVFLQQVLGVTYDQRNSLVVGFAMGFAVIPIIYTVTEDSLSGVPAGLTAGSLALGATRWQTAIRTVLPTASPGIFSAVMIGFGRAVGETMIVLMATGNTPVMDASPFTGFRALSANIAVELPEAPEGGTLFRVLFLAALLLFLMTFAVNTVAEVVRLRLRQRYRTYE